MRPLRRDDRLDPEPPHPDPRADCGAGGRRGRRGALGLVIARCREPRPFCCPYSHLRPERPEQRRAPRTRYSLKLSAQLRDFSRPGHCRRSVCEFTPKAQGNPRHRRPFSQAAASILPVCSGQALGRVGGPYLNPAESHRFLPSCRRADDAAGEPGEVDIGDADRHRRQLLGPSVSHSCYPASFRDNKIGVLGAVIQRYQHGIKIRKNPCKFGSFR